MTAEVAVMNKSGVALATDSAVTISHPTGSKIYNSVNKLFTLSKYHPVGIMIYGSASFMGVPWETIIKIYRKRLGDKEFATLKEYADDFISFLQGEHDVLFPVSEQIKQFKIIVSSYFNYLIRDLIEKRIQDIVGEAGEIEKGQTEEIVASIISENLADWEKQGSLPNVDEDKVKQFIQQHEELVQEIQGLAFSGYELSDESQAGLRQLISCLFTKRRFLSFIFSGIVIAGYGSTEPFPRLYSYLLEVLINGQLKYKEESSRSVEITFDNDVSIITFAQSEMVGTFIEGINPVYRETIGAYLDNLLNGYAESVLDIIPGLNAEDKTSLLERLKQENRKILEDFDKSMTGYQRENHSDPILINVSFLPKDELAKMAEALVNITSLKRRVSVEAETVGGPIDVAVISKGDGFIWIKRKHYFDAKENPYFFNNYFRE